MQKLTTITGIVLRERAIGENDKFIDFLSAEQGLVEIKIRGARKAGSKSAAATQLFSYARLCILKNRTFFYILNSAEVIDSHYAIREDLSKLALVSYFSELMKFTILPEMPCPPAVNLLLAAIRHLCAGDRPQALVKAVFELRLASDIGLMPALIGCDTCGCYADERMYFRLDKGVLLCEHCAVEQETALDLTKTAELDKTLLYIIRYIALVEQERIFHFKTSDKTLAKLSRITERYLRAQLNTAFPTLQFYQEVIADETDPPFLQGLPRESEQT
ncbi:MAG: DNA repair protein RecO [Oscillospiraceae bacterium]